MGQTYQSIVLDAPLEKIWSALSNFHDMSWAAGVIEKTVPVGDKGANEVGAKRVLNDAFHETLLSVDADNRVITYSITDGPSPISKDEVSDYVGRIHLSQITEEPGGTFVEWSSSWNGADEAVGDFCHPIYVALLGCLKKSMA